MILPQDQPGADDEDFTIGAFEVKIHCPKCGNEMVHDGNSLVLAESPRGAQFECGRCEEFSQWSFSWDPFVATQVPLTWGGTL